MFDTEENHGWPPSSATWTTWPKDWQKKVACMLCPKCIMAIAGGLVSGIREKNMVQFPVPRTLD
jgi:hypothetical protein